jgi:hypothetical protein
MPRLTPADAARLGRRRKECHKNGTVSRPRRESEIQREILRYLNTVPGVVAFRMNTGAMRGEHKGKRWFVRFGVPGMSDVIGWRTFEAASHVTVGAPCDACDRGERKTVQVGRADAHVHLKNAARFLAVEVKRPGESLRPAQAAFLESVRRAGGIAIVAHSVDDVRQGLGA